MMTAHEARDRALTYAEHNDELHKALKAVDQAATEGLFTVTLPHALNDQTQDVLMALGYDITITGPRTTLTWY